MKNLKLAVVALAIGLCTVAFGQGVIRDGIYVSDMRGVPEGTIWGEIPYDLPVLIGGGGGGGGGDCPCPKYEQYIHWYTNMHSIALGKETRVGPLRNTTGEPEDQYSIVIGPQSFSEGYANVVIGHMTQADENRAIAIGKGARGSGLSSIAFGDGAAAETNSWGAIAIGHMAYAASTGTGWSKPIAIGLSAKSYDGLAVGHHASTSNGMYSIAIGGGARARNDAIQIGYGENARRGTCKIGGAYFVDVAGVTAAFKTAFENTTNFADFKATFINYLNNLTPYDDIVPSVDPPEYTERPLVQAAGVVKVLAVKDEAESGWNVFSKVLNAVQAFVLALIGIFWAKGKKPEDKPEEPVTEPKKSKRK